MLTFDGYDDLRAYLRDFINPGGGPVDYDFNGTVHLMLALLDNLRAHALDAELEDIGGAFSDEQAAFFVRLAEYLQRSKDSVR